MPGITTCSRRVAGGARTRSWLHLLLGTLLLIAMASPARAQVVISQVYGGDGNFGATWKSDFVTLLNAGTAAADVTGWSIQYASAGGSSWFKATLRGTCPTGGQLQGFLGFGEFLAPGFVVGADSNNNSAGFNVGATNPRNSGSAALTCGAQSEPTHPTGMGAAGAAADRTPRGPPRARVQLACHARGRNGLWNPGDFPRPVDVPSRILPSSRGGVGGTFCTYLARSHDRKIVRFVLRSVLLTSHFSLLTSYFVLRTSYFQ